MELTITTFICVIPSFCDIIFSWFLVIQIYYLPTFSVNVNILYIKILKWECHQVKIMWYLCLQTFDRFRCAQLVMESLCSFKDTSMIRMSVAICSILAAKVMYLAILHFLYNYYASQYQFMLFSLHIILFAKSKTRHMISNVPNRIIVYRSYLR